MGKLTEFTIDLDSPVFYSGSNVTGTVIVDLKKAMKMKKLQLKLHGEAHCHFTETHGTGKHRRTDSYTGHEDHVQMYSVLFGSPETGDETFMHPSGQHVYPFSFILPNNLASSMEGLLGHIRYYLQATIDKPWKFNHDVKMPFTVTEVIDTNHPSYQSLPKPSGSESKEVGCCCCPSGIISMTAEINRTAYCPGESIIINAQALNRSKTDMRAVKAKLNKIIEYHARSKTRSVPTTISTIQSAGILGGGQDTVLTNLPINIPVTPPSILNNGVIKVYYTLQVYVDVPWGFDLVVNLPVILGTVPFRENATWIQEQAPVMGGEPTAPMMETSFAPPASLLPDAPPPSYASVPGDKPVNIKDTSDSQYLRGNLNYIPVYPMAPSST